VAQAAASLTSQALSVLQAESVLQDPSVVQQDAASLTAQALSAPQVPLGALLIPKTIDDKATAATSVMNFFM